MEIILFLIFLTYGLTAYYAPRVCGYASEGEGEGSSFSLVDCRLRTSLVSPIAYCVACIAYWRIASLKFSRCCSIPSCSGFDEVRTMDSGGWGGVGVAIYHVLAGVVVPHSAFFGHSGVDWACFIRFMGSISAL